MGQGFERPGEPELARVECVVQVAKEETAEKARQYPDRQKEARSTGDPAGAVDREAAAGDHAMEMGVNLPFHFQLGIHHFECVVGVPSDGSAGAQCHQRGISVPNRSP
jgi:hypothetical protein